MLIHVSVYLLALPFKESTMVLNVLLLELAERIALLETPWRDTDSNEFDPKHFPYKYASVKKIEAGQQIFIPLRPFTKL